MNFRALFLALASGILWLACEEKQESYDSSVTERTSAQLVVDWGEAESTPSEYSVIFADVDTLTLDSDSNLIEDLPTGDVRLMVYNHPENISVDGSILSVNTPQESLSYNIEQLYTSSSDVYLKSGIVNELNIKMIPRVKQIGFTVDSENASSVTAQFKAASKIDVEYNRLFDSKNIKLELAEAKDGKFCANAKYLGLVGELLKISFEFTDAEENTEKWILDLTAETIGNFSTLPEMMEVLVSRKDGGYVANVGFEEIELYFVPTSYKIGDYYPDATNPEGVVYEISDDGKSGKVVSMTNGHYNFRKTNGSASNNAGTINADDGMVNMNVVKAKDAAFNDYPAYAWCVTLGDGWYLPAKNELISLYEAWKANTAALDGKFSAKGGDEITINMTVGTSNKVILYFSSTENASYKIFWKGFNKDNNENYSTYNTPGQSNSPHYVYRAIKTFEITE